MTSYLKTTILLAGLTALFLGVGYAVGGRGGMTVALIAALGMNVFAYWNSDRMVLSMQGAQEVDAYTAPDFHRLVAELAERAGLPMPRVYLIHSDQPNAFATGRNPENAAVAATTGLLDALTTEQVAGVVAHELAHIKNRDTLIMTIAATIAGAISMIANFGFFFGGSNRESGGNPLGIVGVLLATIAAPFMAMIVQMAISRSREFEADRIGAEICGRPTWLADALERIQHGVRRTHNTGADRNPATAHLFIINPLHGSSLRSLFSTHPATEERVRRLRAMGGMGRGMGTGVMGGTGGYSRPAPSSPRGNAGGNPGGNTGGTGPWGAGTRPRSGPWG